MNVLQQLQAGIRVEFNESGRFLRILASEVQDKITVQFYRNGAMICEAMQVGRGFSETMEDGNFDSYAVTSSVTQNVNIVTRAGSRILYDTPPVGDVNVLNFPSFPANQLTTADAVRYQSSFISTVALGSNTPETIFTPASNINGAIVHACSFISGNNGAGSWACAAIVARTSAPSAIGQGDVICMGEHFTSVTNIGVSGKRDISIFIPAGKGLYYITSAGETQGLRAVLYTLIP